MLLEGLLTPAEGHRPGPVSSLLDERFVELPAWPAVYGGPALLTVVLNTRQPSVTNQSGTGTGLVLSPEDKSRSHRRKEQTCPHSGLPGTRHTAGRPTRRAPPPPGHRQG